MKSKLNILLISFTLLMFCNGICAAPADAGKANATQVSTATTSAGNKSQDTVAVNSTASSDSTTMGDLLDDAALEMEDSTGVAQDDGAQICHLDAIRSAPKNIGCENMSDSHLNI